MSHSTPHNARAAAPPPAAFPQLPPPAWRQQLRRALLGWFKRHGRDLPWRQRGDAYAVWISEVMLQQTTVATVRGYFQRFLTAFPTLHDLARADVAQVLRLWEGLGYYRRARQLHQCAQVLAAEHGGVFPQDVTAACRLPGIGRYTAGAILSIAYDRPAPILEANTQRVYSRLLAYDGDPASAAGRELLWALAEALLPARRGAGRINQALMDLGSLVCTPRQPRCAACPVAELCAAYRLGRQNAIPRPKAKPKIEAVREAAIVVRRGRRVLLLKRPEGQRWAGLWDFPRYGLASDDPAAWPGQLATAVKAQTGLSIRLGRRLTTLKHGVTRFRITLDCYAAEVLPGPRPSPCDVTTRWLEPDQLGDYPLSTTGRKLAQLVQNE